MITVNIDHGRLHRSSTQHLHLMKTSVNCIFIVIGSTGNACIVVISKTAITCNCPDHCLACKHVLFLLSLCGGVTGRQLLVSPALLVQKMHADPSTPQLKAAMLDSHTNMLCSTHKFPPCFFCAKQQAGTLIICPSCGFLSHDSCLPMLPIHDGGVSRCPRCDLPSPRLKSHFVNGHRNFFHVLRHQGHCCLPPSQSSLPFSTHQQHPPPH